MDPPNHDAIVGLGRREQILQVLGNLEVVDRVDVLAVHGLDALDLHELHLVFRV